MIDNTKTAMRNLLILIIAGSLATILFSSSVRTMDKTAARPDMGPVASMTHNISDQDSPEAEDSTVIAIPWFCKRDTMTYWISESEWKYNGTDTVKTAGAYTKVMFTVTDSTKKGYDIEYTFLEFGLDTTASSDLQELYQQAARKLQETTVGTTIRFHTDQMGVIKKYYNLNEIKKKTKAVISDFVAEMTVMDTLADYGFNTDRLLKLIDTDMIIDSYTEEIEMLFQYFGNEYTIGEYSGHSDATDDEYESDTYIAINLDPETYGYEIALDTYNYIPKEDIKDLLGAVIDIFTTEEASADFKSEMDADFDEQITHDGIQNSYLYISFFGDGWPMEAVSQKEFSIGDSGKIRQKHIDWEYRSTGNFE